jgi:hypothetical protein
LAPCFLMITLCWITDSVLFHAQQITSPAGNEPGSGPGPNGLIAT